MSFRLRVALLAAAAVAISVVVASSLMYVALERQLVGQVDGSLKEAAAGARQLGPRFAERFTLRASREALLSGRADIYAQVVDRGGNVVRADVVAVPELVTPEVRAVARGERAEALTDLRIEGVHLRVYAVPFGPGQALELVRPLDEVDRALGQTRVRLFWIALGGVLIAGVLGALVARGALTPVTQLTATIEDVRRTRDLSRRVAASGSDELGRLAASFDAMLGALETSVRAQRQLVADASHELRTPLTSLRTNLELLARGHPTDPEERRTVLVDLVGQMERLSSLVADLIDLARDEETTVVVDDVPLHEVTATAIDDVRGRYPERRFVLDQREESVVRGVRPRIARAITNLLDNAAKWSPPGGMIEVTVARGEVTVRDHGPGVAPEDAPRVFDRFWRSSAARHLPGSGLGLAIVKDVAESHGGSVVLERPPDGGARFRLRLDAARRV